MELSKEPINTWRGSEGVDRNSSGQKLTLRNKNGLIYLPILHNTSIFSLYSEEAKLNAQVPVKSQKISSDYPIQYKDGWPLEQQLVE